MNAVSAASVSRNTTLFLPSPTPFCIAPIFPARSGWLESFWWRLSQQLYCNLSRRYHHDSLRYGRDKIFRKIDAIKGVISQLVVLSLVELPVPSAAMVPIWWDGRVTELDPDAVITERLLVRPPREADRARFVELFM